MQFNYAGLTLSGARTDDKSRRRPDFVSDQESGVRVIVATKSQSGRGSLVSDTIFEDRSEISLPDWRPNLVSDESVVRMRI